MTFFVVSKKPSNVRLLSDLCGASLVSGFIWFPAMLASGFIWFPAMLASGFIWFPAMLASGFWFHGWSKIFFLRKGERTAPAKEPPQMFFVSSFKCLFPQMGLSNMGFLDISSAQNLRRLHEFRKRGRFR